MKVLHLLPTLEVGGAERFVERLAPTLAARHGVEQRVIGLAGDGPAGVALRRAGIAAEAVSAGGVAGLVRAAQAARVTVATWRPDVVQTWLYVADLAGAVATFGRPGTRLVWNLRCSDAWLTARTRTIRRACIALAARAPDAIVACGDRAASFHAELGYPAGAMTVIPNGFRFASLDATLAERAARRAGRAGRSGGAVVVGCAGRYDRAKGYGYLLAAIARLRADGHDVRLAMAGRGCVPANDALAGEIARHRLTGLVDLRGELDDMASFFADLDVFCLSSVSEGFPNVLCEAIASGVPAVATGVGDAPQIMAPQGTIAPRSVEALTWALAGLLDTPRAAREAGAVQAARRVRAAYDLDAIADRYHALYVSLPEGPNAAQP